MGIAKSSNFGTTSNTQSKIKKFEGESDGN